METCFLKYIEIKEKSLANTRVSEQFI